MNIHPGFILRKWCQIPLALSLLLLLSACSTSYPRNSAGINIDETGAVPTIKVITPELVQSQRKQRDSQAGHDVRQLIGRPTPYLIESGDVLSIVVWGHPELSNTVMTTPAVNLAGAEGAGAPAQPPGFVVDHDGMLQFPFAGAIKIAGLTEEQARNLLASKIARYINQPNITLRVQSFRSKRIYVDGEVKAPGLQAINDIPMTLVEALNRAGGVLPSADQSRIVITRESNSYYVNIPQMMHRGFNPASILLQTGDVVRVFSRDENKVFVAGEVTSPKALTMHNGRLTLNEALGESGGINPLSGDAGQVYVVRKTDKEPIVFQLKADTPGALAMAEGFELQPKDLIYVAATPLANWHRTISLILPGALSSAFSAGKQ